MTSPVRVEQSRDTSRGSALQYGNDGQVGPMGANLVSTSRDREGKIGDRKRVSKALIRSSLEIAEEELRWCQQVVAELSHTKIAPDVGQRIIGFQLRLYDAILGLEKIYRLIKQEEKNLIRRKAKLNREWFGRRMAKLASYTNFLKEVLAIGRALGDAFAWFFYERDRKLIAEHLKQQRQNLLPPDLGGAGERITLEKMQGFGGKLLISHGTTTFLRLGDVSLIDLETLRVSCVGELKTTRIDSKTINVSMSFIAGDRDQLPRMPENIKRSDKVVDIPPLPAKMKDRFARQMKTMQGSIVRVNGERSGKVISTQGEFYYSELEEVVREAKPGRFAFVQAGNGMLISAYRIPMGQTLTQSVMGDKTGNLLKALDEMPEWVSKIMKPEEKERNSLRLGSFAGAENLHACSKSLPLMSWPMDSEILSEILFGRVIVITMFNPIHLMCMIRNRGFEIDVDERGRLKLAHKLIGDRKMEFFHYDQVLMQVPQSLMTEDSVLRMFDESVCAAEAAFDGRPMKMEFQSQILRGSAPLQRQSEEF